MATSDARGRAMLRVERALISVSDKTGIGEFAGRLHRNDVEVIATGGTALTLEREGIPIVRVESLTDTPELLGGRVKTLHPTIYAGILAMRGNPIHMAVLEELGIPPIDMVVVNLYPFERCLEEGRPRDEMIENIDIGGVGLIRAAAKNHEHVAVITSPEQYGPVIAEIDLSGGLGVETLRRLAAEAFRRTMEYDGSIHAYLAGGAGPAAIPAGLDTTGDLTLVLRKAMDLRYGENPDESGMLYAWSEGPSVIDAEQLHGMPMSYNNYLDIYAGASLVSEFDEPTIAILKHTNPCGVASAETPLTAYKHAIAGDRISAFGGIVSSNRNIGGEVAAEIIGIFTEVVVAPAFTDAALEVLTRRKNLRVIRWPTMLDRGGNLELRSIGRAFLGKIAGPKEEEHGIVPTDRSPTRAEWVDLRFAWKVVAHVKSNAIVVAKGRRTVGIGAGQMSRIDSVKIAVERAGKRAKDAVLASDGFFPFPDSVEHAANAGISAIIQPGGSVKDKEVIRAADDHGIAMVFTRKRTFLH